MAKFDAKAKAKRQKIIAAVLGVALLGVLAYEVPSVLKMMHKKPAAATATPAPPTVPATGSPSTGVPAAGTPVAAVSGSTSLVDSDPPARPAAGQLISFDRFATKDPFVQRAGALAAGCEGSSCTTGTTTETPAPKPAQPKPAKTPAPAPAPPPAPSPAGSSAKISVNGEAETVAVSGNFPESDPVFVLVALTRTTAKIGIAGGSLASGDQTVTLTKGKKVTLMNTADGTRYELVLLSVS